MMRISCIMLLLPCLLLLANETDCDSKCASHTGTKLPPDASMQEIVRAWVEDPNSTEHGTDIGCWDVSDVTSMKSAFSHQKEFNDDLSCWDVSKVTDMSMMFFVATKFNQPLSSWDTGKVESISDMFYQAYEFDQNIGGWDVRKVKSASGVFEQASKFDQSLYHWNLDSVEEIYHFFAEAENFNQNMGRWGEILPGSIDTANVFRGTSCEDSTSWPSRGGIWCCGSCPIPCDPHNGEDDCDDDDEDHSSHDHSSDNESSEEEEKDSSSGGSKKKMDSVFSLPYHNAAVVIASLMAALAPLFCL